ncbi:endonuclease dU [Kaarinaea lacus]
MKNTVQKSISHVVGFDDAPFNHDNRRNVLIVGTVFAGHRLDGVLSAHVRRDGVNSTTILIDLLQSCRFYPQLQAVFLQGIAFGGFNVIDIHRLYEQLALPVIVVSRTKPNLSKIKAALLGKVPGGLKKWQLIEKAGLMERIANVYVQRVGLDKDKTSALITRFAVNSVIPEPLRTAHLIAGGVVLGESKHRV